MFDARANTSRRSLLVLLSFGVCIGTAFGAPGSPSQAETFSPGQAATTVPEGAAAFDLKEISTFDLPDPVRSRFLFGTYAECLTEPQKEVRQYPAFQSGKPLYGSFHIGGARTDTTTGYHYQFAIDESAGSGKGYDRMYLDLNANGDLTDDGCSQPMRDVPAKALISSSSLSAQVCFNPIALRLKPEDDPQRRLEVMPRFFAYAGDRHYATLVTTKAREGTVEIGGTKFKAILGHSYGIPGWFDDPATSLYLFAEGSPTRPAVMWYGGEQLMAMHRQGDTYYRFSATPTGDKLFIRPYQGAFGVLEIQSGGRNVTRVSVTGSLSSEDTALSLTECLGTMRLTAPTGSYRLPVGDYGPLMLNINYDTLQCMVLRNMHADGAPRGRALTGPAVHAIQIRADRPFVLDLSGKPQVLFADPRKDHRVKRGGQLDVKAVLIDPSLDIMFRSVRQGGQLDPKVVIRRTNGEIVAEGVMPFG